jgi:thioredoxin 1
MADNINDQNFEERVLKNSKLTLVDFWAPWCGPCQALAPVIDEVANEMEEVDVVKCNIDENPETPSKHQVRSIPTLTLFKNGKAISTKVGSISKGALKDWVKENNK